MKVKVVENDQEKLIDASYIIVDGTSLKVILERLSNIETRLSNITMALNKKEENLIKMVKNL